MFTISLWRRLETFFDRDEMFGVSMAPDTFIILSSFLSLKTSTMLHVKLLSLEKGYFGFKVVYPNSLQCNCSLTYF